MAEGRGGMRERPEPGRTSSPGGVPSRVARRRRVHAVTGCKPSRACRELVLPPSSHSSSRASTVAAIRRRASYRGTPLISNWSYGVSVCRTAARTAAVTAASDSARPAALRPTRPLPRTEACAAIACARSAGQPGNSPRISRANASVNRRSSASRRRVPCPAPPSRLRVRQAPLLGPGERRLLDEDALPLVPAPPPVEAHHHRRQRAALPRPARQRGVAPRQEHQVSQVRAVQTA